MGQWSAEYTAYAEANQFCELCWDTGWGEPASPPHHITRGSGGDDSEENLVSLCPRHHKEVHAVGRVSFIKAYLGTKTIAKFRKRLEDYMGR